MRRLFYKLHLSRLGVDSACELPLNSLDDVVLVPIGISVNVGEGVNHDVDGCGRLHRLISSNFSQVPRVTYSDPLIIKGIANVHKLTLAGSGVRDLGF